MIFLHLWEEKYGWESCWFIFTTSKKMVWKTAKSECKMQLWFYNDNHIKCVQFLIFMPNTLYDAGKASMKCSTKVIKPVFENLPKSRIHHCKRSKIRFSSLCTNTLYDLGRALWILALKFKVLWKELDLRMKHFFFLYFSFTKKFFSPKKSNFCAFLVQKFKKKLLLHLRYHLTKWCAGFIVIWERGFLNELFFSKK